jgi:CBS domain containing-hemolysin-like protein
VTTLGLAGALALILANAFFVAIEFSLLTVDKTEVEAAAAAGDRRAGLIAAALRRLSLHLSGVQLGITVSSVVLGFVAQPTVAKALRGPFGSFLSAGASKTVSLIVALALATVVQMVIGELIPKALAVSRPLATARAIAPAMVLFFKLFGPVVALFSTVADRAARLLGIEPKEELSTAHSRPELVRVVRMSQTAGTIDAAEASLLTRAFRFGDKTADDAITPRPDVVTLPIDATGGDLIDRCAATGLSRFPVVGTDIDDIEGVVHVKALLDIPFEERRAVPVRDLMVEPFVVPESRDLGHLLLELRDGTASLAVVLDEYGGTAGIVTIEDLFEEIVGDIEDEHDPARRRVRPLGTTTLVPGGLHPDEVFDATGFQMPDGDYETIAGFVLDRLGHIPRRGEVVTVDGWRLAVIRMDRRRIATVQVTSPPTPVPPSEVAD